MSDNIVRVFFYSVGFVGCCFESDIDFYVRPFRIDISALEPKGQAPFGSEDFDRVLPPHARLNFPDLTQDLGNPRGALLVVLVAHRHGFILNLSAAFYPFRE